MATSVKPKRQGRPKVSLIMTATRLPVSWRRARSEFFRGKIGIAREQSYDIFAGNVRMVDAGIGAHETVACFGNQHMIAANDAPRLLQDDFDGAGIFLQARGERESLRRRADGREPHDRTFGLGDNFLRDDEDVSVFERDACFARGGCNLSGQIVAQLNLRQSGQANQTEITAGDGRFL